MALITWAFVGLVLLIAAVLVVLKLTRGATAVPAPSVAGAPASVVRTVTGLPASVFDAVGAPSGSGPGPQVLEGQPALDTEGLPEVVFVGGEFSPYSAAARWALVAALSRFGTFGHLGATSSSTDEVFPGTPTFTFDGAEYHSTLVTFVAVEAYGQSPSDVVPAGFPVLHPPSAAVLTLLRRYDSPGPGQANGADAAVLPFIDVGNRVLFVGAGIGFSPGVLRGDSMTQVAASMADPANPEGRAVIGAADAIAAAICAATGGKPALVCSSPGVRAGAVRLGIS